MNDDQARRFRASAQRQGECLVWTKSRRRNGYGQIKVNGRNRTAHRVAYELANGPIPDGLSIDHTCRNRACIEPRHLRLATTKQNAENRVSRPASVSGIRGVHWDRSRLCWVAKLTHHYKTVNLGRFTDRAEAARAVTAARASLFTHAN